MAKNAFIAPPPIPALCYDSHVMKKETKKSPLGEKGAPKHKADPRLAEIRQHAVNNDIEILKSVNCSCFFCRQTYSARKVSDWITDERGVTAICPECGMDAVVGDAAGFALDRETLKALNLLYYGEDYMGKHPEAALKYVDRYKEGKITRNKANEALYIQYLSLLASRGNPDAAFDLGDLYENGTEFTPADPKTAFSYYGMDSLSKDGDALTRRGILCESGALGKADPRGAYECYAKAMAMGSLEGLVRFSDCYAKGVFVKPDERFAFDCLYDVWPECYNRFVASTGKEFGVFSDVSYRLGLMFLKGRGAKKDEFLALRLFLFAQFGYQLMGAAGALKGDRIASYQDTANRIEELASKFNLRKQDPVFDNDTFSDSLEFDEAGQLGPNHQSVFAPAAFDKAEGTFDFDITYQFPPLIVDCGNLFCGFVPGTIHWSFTEVSDVQFGRDGTFDHVIGNPDDGWRFLAGPENDSETVALIVFLRQREEKAAKPARKAEVKKEKA
jgi:TPR repeat protein